MSAREPVVISGAVEGLIDEAVLRSLIHHVGARPGPIYGKHGKQFLQRNLAAYNRAAEAAPWVILVDLDHDADCPPPFLAAWLPRPTGRLCFRVVVREIEAWLLADRDRLAPFLGVASHRIPPDPERLPDPKHALVELARHSSRREVRHEMTPRPGSGRAVGPAYNAMLIEFVLNRRRGWRPDVAAARSESLRRCVRCLSRLAQKASGQPS